MTEQPGGPKQAAILEDWITIWQSELAGLATDREMQDTVLRAVDGWAAQARAMLRMMEPALRGLDDRHHATRADAAAGATSVVAAPVGSHAGHGQPHGQPGDGQAGERSDRRDAAIAGLLARVDELERQLAAARAVQTA